jgi:uncharacterized membrane protein
MTHGLGSNNTSFTYYFTYNIIKGKSHNVNWIRRLERGCQVMHQLRWFIFYTFTVNIYIIEATNSGTGMAHEPNPCGARGARTRRQARREGKGTNLV